MSTAVDNRGRQRKRVGRCRDCSAHMLWVSSPTGARIPLDPNPSPYGHWVFLLERDGIRLAANVSDDELRDSLKGIGYRSYTHHFDTCPKRKDNDPRAGR